MDWLTSIRIAIDYIEKHLTHDISVQDVANQVHISPFFLQKGFLLMTGYGIGEYIRNRRLSQAALDLQKTNEKVIDIAFKYCYETPESFTKRPSHSALLPLISAISTSVGSTSAIVVSTALNLAPVI